MKERVLVTGATGFVGRKLVGELKKKYKVISLSTKNGNLGSLLVFPEVDYVVHLAACMDGDNQDECLATNVLGMKNLVSYYRKKKLKKFIFVSSMSVLDGAGGHKTRTDSWYIKTKLMAEKMLIESNIPFVILYPPAILDMNQPKMPLPAKLMGGFPGCVMSLIGSEKRLISYVWLDDLVEALGLLIAKKIVNRKYTVVSEELGMADFRKKMSEIFSGWLFPIRIPVTIIRVIAKIIKLPVALRDVANFGLAEGQPKIGNLWNDIGYRPNSLLK